jgi:two-component system nitrogen regulation sensor histidine kinase NtrY
MISKNLYINLIVRVLLIAALSVFLGFLIARGNPVRLSVILFLAIIILTANLVHYLNSINRKIRYFFDSVKDDDSSLSFSEKENNSTIREIYREMNRINMQIQKLKIENRNQEQYFRVLIEHLPIGVITFNGKGMILHSNSSAKRLLMAEVLTHIRQLERTDQKLYQAVKSIRPSERRLVGINTERGEIELSFKATSFSGNGNELTILSVQDIKNELDEREVESWMKLIRVLMHEIMNSITPITSLSGSLSELFIKDGRQAAPGEITQKEIYTTINGLNVIKEQGRSLTSFVETYRQLTRIPEPDKQFFRASELLDRVKVLFGSLENKSGTRILFFLKDPELEIYADQSLICQVLLNLIKNALEANELNPDGEVTVSASADSDLRPEICVSDNGPGIPRENLDKIFVPFFTTKKNGSGIGLSISRQIMRVHGGNLQVRPVSGGRIAFCLSFNRT